MDNDFLSFFNNAINNNNIKYTEEDELDSLWEAYESYVQELKDDGCKVLRNSNGKHKIIR